MSEQSGKITRGRFARVALPPIHDSLARKTDVEEAVGALSEYIQVAFPREQKHHEIPYGDEGDVFHVVIPGTFFFPQANSEIKQVFDAVNPRLVIGDPLRAGLAESQYAVSLAAERGIPVVTDIFQDVNVARTIMDSSIKEKGELFEGVIFQEFKAFERNNSVAVFANRFGAALGMTQEEIHAAIERIGFKLDKRRGPRAVLEQEARYELIVERFQNTANELSIAALEKFLQEHDVTGPVLTVVAFSNEPVFFEEDPNLPMEKSNGIPPKALVDMRIQLIRSGERRDELFVQQTIRLLRLRLDHLLKSKTPESEYEISTLNSFLEAIGK